MEEINDEDTSVYGDGGKSAGARWCVPTNVINTPETCLPVPPEVAERLRAGAPVPETLRNINSDDGTRTYCVRCFVWRPAGLQGRGRPHHCRVCQRCVLHFDHHLSLIHI